MSQQLEISLLSTPGHVSQRAVRQLVNFGTVSLARVLGSPPNELLTLRCECGARDCAATIEAIATEHEDGGSSLVMVEREHAAAVPGTVVASNDRFVKVQVDDSVFNRDCAHRVSMIGEYFVAQMQRPSGLRDVDVAALTPYHRALLVNDGTVTRLVEASVLEPVGIDVLDQHKARHDEQLVSWLEPSAATAASILRRRVAIRGRDSDRVYGVAESVLAAPPLPRTLVRSLTDCPKGLGEMIGQARLETRRELLWFGYANAPDWAETIASGPLLSRAYRILINSTPAIIVSESFPLDDPTRARAAPSKARL